MLFTNFCENSEIKDSGEKISQKLAHNMVYETYWQKIIIDHLREKDPIKKEEILKETVAVRYKRCLFDSILSDGNCIGIRFYFTETTKNDLTLVIVGYGEDGKDLTATNDSKSIIMENGHDSRNNDQQTYIAEVGGGDSFVDFYNPNKPFIPARSGRVLNLGNSSDKTEKDANKVTNNILEPNEPIEVFTKNDAFKIGMSNLFASIVEQKSSELGL